MHVTSRISHLASPIWHCALRITHHALRVVHLASHISHCASPISHCALRISHLVARASVLMRTSRTASGRQPTRASRAGVSLNSRPMPPSPAWCSYVRKSKWTAGATSWVAAPGGGSCGVPGLRMPVCSGPQPLMGPCRDRLGRALRYSRWCHRRSARALRSMPRVLRMRLRLCEVGFCALPIAVGLAQTSCSHTEAAVVCQHADGPSCQQHRQIPGASVSGLNPEWCR